MSAFIEIEAVDDEPFKPEVRCPLSNKLLCVDPINDKRAMFGGELEELKLDVTVLGCGHLFHTHSLEQHVQSKSWCPTCNSPLTQEDISALKEQESNRAAREEKRLALLEYTKYEGGQMMLLMRKNTENTTLTLVDKNKHLQDALQQLRTELLSMMNEKSTLVDQNEQLQKALEQLRTEQAEQSAGAARRAKNIRKILNPP